MNQLNEDMGFMYIAEQTTPDDYKIKNLDVTNKSGIFFVDFDACLHSFEIINRNQRQYLGDNIWSCIQESERIQSMLADNAWYGEMDHPTQETTNGKLTPERIQAIWMPNRSHKIMNPRIEGNLLNAHIQTASGTEAGRGFAQEIIQGLVPSFSCRAIASLKLLNNKPTVIARKLITYDWVLFPSHKEAKETTPAKGVIKIIQTVTESVKNRISTDALIPLKEILESVGRKDVNTQVIMESFNLDNDNLVGFTESKKHLIIKDENNVIYSKISPESVKQVKDFYRSFNI